MSNVVNLSDYSKPVRVIHENPTKASGPVETRIQHGNAVVILGDGEVGLDVAPFPYPSAPAVDSRYMEALKRQRGE